MPALYRSKSVRRLDDSSNSLINFIEKDNKKILAVASVQLFISTSTPNVDKWFKSRTGTICFLKDFTRRGCYCFRLVSLMQGQLWEQEIQTPFSYTRKSCLFHFITRFNYGFKFLCEDEAEQFSNVILKFSSQDKEFQDLYCEEKISLPSSSNNSNDNKMASSVSARTSARYSMISNLSIETRKSRRNRSATPLDMFQNNGVPKNVVHYGFSQSATSSGVKQNLASSDNEFTSLNDECKSRKTALSCDRRRKIEKSSISCPFTCSVNDLNINQSNNSEIDSNNNQLTSKACLNSKISSSHNQISVERNASNTSQKIQPNVKQAVCALTKSGPNTKSERALTEETKKWPIPPSPSSTNSSLNASPNPNRKLMSAKMSEREIKHHRYENRLIDEKTEFDITKEILINYNVPIDKKLIKSLKQYIDKYGNIEKFKKALESEEERTKFASFVAESSAALIGANQTNSANHLESPSKQNKFQAIHPSQMLSNVSPHKHHKHNHYQTGSLNNVMSTPSNHVHLETPATPVASHSHGSHRTNHSYQLLTPLSVLPKHMQNTSHTLPERTPIRTNPYVSSNNRNRTPSPTRGNSNARQNSIATSNTTPPPKPPHRYSLKGVGY